MFRKLPAVVSLACASSLLGGCQVLASLGEDATLRAIALGVAIAAIVGFLVARMRR